jgi:glycerol-3-phosphate dehydrogenase
MVEKADFDSLSKDKFDLIIIGGGITGAGLFRQTAAMGWKVLLLEAKDFASGTSSRSTKLIHGGIRYLQSGEWRLVAEGARERQRILQLAPHLARPVDLLLTAPNLFLAIKYWLGVSLYEWLGRVRRADRHRLLWGRRLSAFEPALNHQKFPFGIVYREYLTDDARLVLANIRAGRADGGVAINYAPVTALHEEVDETSGYVGGVVVTQNGAEQVLRADLVVNAAGPWVADILAMDGGTDNALVLSKGVHVVVTAADLPIAQPCMLVAHDARPVFVIPSDTVVYIGTTDTRFEQGDPYWPGVEQQEVDYLLDQVNAYFKVDLTDKQVVGSWAGIRPLIAERKERQAGSRPNSADGQSGSADPEVSVRTSEVSRKDEVWLSPRGLFTIAGGKLTGYLKMSERVVAALVRQCPRLGRSTLPSLDRLPGAQLGLSDKQVVRRLQQTVNIDPKVLERLALRYGDEAVKVIALGQNPIAQDLPVLTGEVVWALRQESAKTLEDVVYRRLGLPLYQPERAGASLTAISLLMSHHLGWDEHRRLREVEQTAARLKTDLVFESNSAAD